MAADRQTSPICTSATGCGCASGRRQTRRCWRRSNQGATSSGWPDGTAILGDKRNDENKIVSQLHGAFIAFHNKVVMDDAMLDSFGADRSTSEARFAAAASIVRWHYQWIVVHDFLQRVCRARDGGRRC